VERRLPDVEVGCALLLADLAELPVVEQHQDDVHPVLDGGRHLGD
jgi:hypothetical protein